MRRALSANFSRSITSKILRPTAQASGVPPNVLAWVPAERTFANFSRTQNAPIGNPPPSDFAIETASGRYGRLPSITSASKIRCQLWNFPVRK